VLEVEAEWEQRLGPDKFTQLRALLVELQAVAEPMDSTA
jgi:hypothetical protein